MTRNSYLSFGFSFLVCAVLAFLTGNYDGAGMFIVASVVAVALATTE